MFHLEPEFLVLDLFGSPIHFKFWWIIITDIYESLQYNQ